MRTGSSGGSQILILAAAFAALFLLTGLLGVWAAFDRNSAWQAFALIALGLLAATAVVWAGQRWGEMALGVMSLGVALLAGAIGLYFLLAYHWSGNTGEIALLQQIGLAVEAARPAIPLPTDINANVAAGGLTMTLFIGLGGLIWAILTAWWPGLVVAGMAWLVGLAALVLSQSRGAWISTGVGVAAILYLALRRRWVDRRGLRIVLDSLALVALLAIVAFFIAAVRSPDLAQILGTTSVGTSAVNRATLWRDGLGLVSDYPFTGSGLRSTMMVYSTYELLMHVGFILHMHNLFVQIAVSQGVVAVLAFAGLLAAAIANLLAATRSRRSIWRFSLTAGAALAALLAHGMVDAGVYASTLTPILFLPVGFALALRPGRHQRQRGSMNWVLAVAILSVTALALVVFLPAGRAALQENLGAVSQTRAELSRYVWPDWPIQDELRRSPEVDLEPAIARYRAALAANPANASANRRLSQIELARGDYASARALLETAYATTPSNRATRQLLGELYAIDGETTRAAEMLSTVDTSLNQLDLRVFWYTHIGEQENAERLKQVAGS